MAEVMPVIPKASEIIVHTGNTVNWSRIKKNVIQSPQDELAECVSSTIGEWKSQQDLNDLQEVGELVCHHDKQTSQLSEEERQKDLKITVKVFCPSVEKGCVTQAVNEVLLELGTGYVETVLLSVPCGRETLADVRHLWTELEELVTEGKVLSLGVAEFNAEQLEALYNDVQVKPSVVQVNLDVCCTVPPELQTFAKENDIQLLTHNDPQDILPVLKFQEIMAMNFSQRDGESWEPTWVTRYSVLVKCRGVIKSKGYITRAERDLKKRK